MFGVEIWIVVGAALVVIAAGAFELRRRRVRRQKADAGWDKLYPLW